MDTRGKGGPRRARRVRVLVLAVVLSGPALGAAAAGPFAGTGGAAPKPGVHHGGGQGGGPGDPGTPAGLGVTWG